MCPSYWSFLVAGRLFLGLFSCWILSRVSWILIVELLGVGWIGFWLILRDRSPLIDAYRFLLAPWSWATLSGADLLLISSIYSQKNSHALGKFSHLSRVVLGFCCWLLKSDFTSYYSPKTNDCIYGWFILSSWPILLLGLFLVAGRIFLQWFWVFLIWLWSTLIHDSFPGAGRHSLRWFWKIPNCKRSILVRFWSWQLLWLRGELS